MASRNNPSADIAVPSHWPGWAPRRLAPCGAQIKPPSPSAPTVFTDLIGYSDQISVGPTPPAVWTNRDKEDRGAAPDPAVVRSTLAHEGNAFGNHYFSI